MDKLVYNAIIAFNERIMRKGRSDYAIETIKSLNEPEKTNSLRNLIIKCLADGQYEYALKVANYLTETERNETNRLLLFYKPAVY